VVPTSSPGSRRESTEGTVDTLHRRMNEVSEKKKGQIARDHDIKNKEAEAPIDLTLSMGKGITQLTKLLAGSFSLCV
jgi:hypothetical protein